MLDPLEPGPSGEPLPAGEIVLRLTKASLNGQADLNAFVLSSRDQASPLKGLSVFAERLTTAEQARSLLSPEYVFALRLPVDAIRSMRPEPDVAAVPPLDVVWDTLVGDDGKRDERLGANGHAGITGLNHPASFPKDAYRSLRSRLADLAQSQGTVEITRVKEENP